jgi:hypothetical protein
LLVTLYAGIEGALNHVTIGKAVRQFQADKWWERNLPEIRIENGRVSSPATQPFVKELQREGEVYIFVLDTTGATGTLDPTYRQGVLLTEHEVIARDRDGSIQGYSLRRVRNFVLNQVTLERWGRILATWAWLVAGSMTWILQWIITPFWVLCWSLFSLVVNTVARRQLRYGALLRIGILAVTVPLAFDLLIDALGWRLGWLPSVALYVAYLIWAILVQPPPHQEASALPPQVGAPS